MRFPQQTCCAGATLTRRGLAGGDAARRLAEYCPDAPPERKQEGFLEELLESFREPLQLPLIVVAVLPAEYR